MAKIGWQPRDLDKLRQDIDQLFDRLREAQQGEENLAPLRRDINRLLDHVWEGQKERAWVEGTWNPMVDVADMDAKILVSVELPGIKQKDVQVSTDGDMLTIQGEKWPDKKSKDIPLHRAERTFGSFSRSLRLPVRVKSNKVKVVFKNGILLLEMKKTKPVGRQGVELEEKKAREPKKEKRSRAQATPTPPAPESAPPQEAQVAEQPPGPEKTKPSRKRKGRKEHSKKKRT